MLSLVSNHKQYLKFGLLNSEIYGSYFEEHSLGHNVSSAEVGGGEMAKVRILPGYAGPVEPGEQIVLDHLIKHLSDEIVLIPNISIHSLVLHLGYKDLM